MLQNQLSQQLEAGDKPEGTQINWVTMIILFFLLIENYLQFGVTEWPFIWRSHWIQVLLNPHLYPSDALAASLHETMVWPTYFIYKFLFAPFYGIPLFHLIASACLRFGIIYGIYRLSFALTKEWGASILSAVFITHITPVSLFGVDSSGIWGALAFSNREVASLALIWSLCFLIEQKYFILSGLLFLLAAFTHVYNSVHALPILGVSCVVLFFEGFRGDAKIYFARFVIPTTIVLLIVLLFAKMPALATSIGNYINPALGTISPNEWWAWATLKDADDISLWWSFQDGLMIFYGCYVLIGIIFLRRFLQREPDNIGARFVNAFALGSLAYFVFFSVWELNVGIFPERIDAFFGSLMVRRIFFLPPLLLTPFIFSALWKEVVDEALPVSMVILAAFAAILFEDKSTLLLIAGLILIMPLLRKQSGHQVFLAILISISFILFPVFLGFLTNNAALQYYGSGVRYGVVNTAKLSVPGLILVPVVWFFPRITKRTKALLVIIAFFASLIVGLLYRNYSGKVKTVEMISKDIEFYRVIDRMPIWNYYDRVQYFTKGIIKTDERWLEEKRLFQWIGSNTPQGSMILPPPYMEGFRLHAHRPVVWEQIFDGDWGASNLAYARIYLGRLQSFYQKLPDTILTQSAITSMKSGIYIPYAEALSFRKDDFLRLKLPEPEPYIDDGSDPIARSVWLSMDEKEIQQFLLKIGVQAEYLVTEAQHVLQFKKIFQGKLYAVYKLDSH